MNNAGVYLIENRVNGKVYCGSSKNLTRRFYNHQRELKKGIHKNPHLQSAYNKYGEDNFTYRVVEFVEKEEDLVIREQFWLDQFDKLKRYNIRTTAESNRGCKLGRMSQHVKDNLTEKLGTKVRMLSLDGIFIKEFRSFTEVGVEMGFCVGYIGQVVRENKQIACGYMWERI